MIQNIPNFGIRQDSQMIYRCYILKGSDFPFKSLGPVNIGQVGNAAAALTDGQLLETGIDQVGCNNRLWEIPSLGDFV